MTVTISSSSNEMMTNPQRLVDAMREGHVIRLADLGYTIAPTAELVSLADELAEEGLLEEMVSYRKDVTGVDNTVFISPKGNTRHAARIKLAIDPPHTADPRGNTAVVRVADSAVVAGDIPPRLLEQVRRFVDANREVLLDYWEYRIDTEMLRQRLKAV